jgi:hypothetical protein
MAQPSSSMDLLTGMDMGLQLPGHQNPALAISELRHEANSLMNGDCDTAWTPTRCCCLTLKHYAEHLDTAENGLQRTLLHLP